MAAVPVGENEVSGGGGSLDFPDAAPDFHRDSTFRGSGEYSIDDKGRLTLPSHMRKPFSGGGVLKVIDNRVVVWPEATYQDLVDMLNGRVRSGDLEQRQVRMFLTASHPVSPDAQGRIVVPQKVRDETGLGKDVFVAGCGPRIELWPSGLYESEMLLEQDDSVANALDEANF